MSTIGPITIIFILSIILMMVVSLSRYFNLRFLRKYDGSVQRLVTRASVKILNFSYKVKRFILVHMYRMSSESIKSALRRTTEKRDALLEKLKGNTPRLSRQRVNESVSPYLREIPGIDRNNR